MDHTPIAIGTRTFWVSDEPKLVLLHPEDRAQHLYVVGKTGLGKSTLLRNLILQDLYAGRGVGLLDPHGDLAREVLDAIPKERTGEVLYFNPGDLARPVGLNLLPKVPPDAAHLVVSGVLSAFRGIWGSSWGPRLEYILGHALAALLDRGLTILALPKLLSDDAFRERVTAKVRDPVVRAFWREEYAGYERRFRLEAIAPLQNKIGRLLGNAPMRNIMGQTKSRFDAGFLMDRGRIMIADLAKGVIGEGSSRLLGALLLSQFQWAAMQRSGNPDSPRTPFHLYIDEFQSFATDALTSILAEAPGSSVRSSSEQNTLRKVEMSPSRLPVDWTYCTSPHSSAREFLEPTENEDHRIGLVRVGIDARLALPVVGRRTRGRGPRRGDAG